jgi:hypothetical protein
MQAIITKYHGATNTRGSRISATAANGARVSIGHDSALNSEQNHAAAAIKLCKRIGWKGALMCGSLPAGYVFVWVDDLASALANAAAHVELSTGSGVRVQPSADCIKANGDFDAERIAKHAREALQEVIRID